MPVSVRKVKGGYQVRSGGRVKAKRTTKRKAQRQARLLRGIEHGLVPRGRSRRGRRRR